MSPDVQPPILDRYGYTWVQHPDELYYGPPYLGADDTLRDPEADGTLGLSAVRRGSLAISCASQRRTRSPAPTASAGRRGISAIIP
jgi:hypothetical protein